MRLPSKDSPFAGTASYYNAFRAPYPLTAIDFLIASFRLDGGARVLDLGTGPGTIAIPISYSAGEILAVDPDADMIKEGQRLAASCKRPNIQWLQSGAEDVPVEVGSFHLTTIGQAFHWMDRDKVLTKLALLTSEGGGLALVNPGKRRPQESWEPIADRIVERFLGPRVRHPRSNPQEPKHEPALQRSEYFSEFTAREFPTTITRSVDSIIGCIYSISHSARQLFGDDATSFEVELTQALLKQNPIGIFRERVETEVIIAFKRARKSICL